MMSGNVDMQWGWKVRRVKANGNRRKRRSRLATGEDDGGGVADVEVEGLLSGVTMSLIVLLHTCCTHSPLDTNNGQVRDASLSLARIPPLSPSDPISASPATLNVTHSSPFTVYRLGHFPHPINQRKTALTISRLYYFRSSYSNHGRRRSRLRARRRAR